MYFFEARKQIGALLGACLGILALNVCAAEGAVILKAGNKKVTLFSESHPHSKKIKSVPKHERWLVQVASIKHSNGLWCKVDYKGTKGWVKRKRLTLDKQAMDVVKKHKYCLKPSQRNKTCFLPSDNIAKK